MIQISSSLMKAALSATPTTGIDGTVGASVSVGGAGVNVSAGAASVDVDSAVGWIVDVASGRNVFVDVTVGSFPKRELFPFKRKNPPPTPMISSGMTTVHTLN